MLLCIFYTVVCIKNSGEIPHTIMNNGATIIITLRPSISMNKVPSCGCVLGRDVFSRGAYNWSIGMTNMKDNGPDNFEGGVLFFGTNRLPFYRGRRHKGSTNW